MRAAVQRVAKASVEVDEQIVARIDQGFLVYLGVEVEDSEADATGLAEKVRYLRVFEDDSRRMNLDVGQIGGEVLVVSAFTVCADARQGRRPAFVGAAKPEIAVPLYERFCVALTEYGVRVQQGRFRERMSVHSTNSGPVCILLDSRKHF